MTKSYQVTKSNVWRVKGDKCYLCGGEFREGDYVVYTSTAKRAHLRCRQKTYVA